MGDQNFGSEVGSEVAGNTKRQPTTSKSRGWMLTINNPTQEDINSIHADNHDYAIYQLERGKEGTLHIQGFIYYKSQRVMPKKKYPRAHLEPARNISNCIKYCSKEESRVEGPVELGVKPTQGRRTDLEAIADKMAMGVSIKEVATEHPEQFIRYHKGLQALQSTLYSDRTEKPRVVWIFGKSGKGKSCYVFKKHKSVYIKDGTQWWDGYTQQEVILIDDFDGKWPFRDLLRLLDRYPYQGQFKGGYVKINSPFIYITCEFPPEHIYNGSTIEGSLLTAVTDDENRLMQVLRRIDEIIEMETTRYLNTLPVRTKI